MATSTSTVYDVCKAYLYDVQVNGSKKTLSDRLDTLFDLCWGLPPEYRGKKTFDPINRRKAEKQRIHEGYGRLLAMSITLTHINKWIAAHDNWTQGGTRTRIRP